MNYHFLENLNLNLGNKNDETVIITNNFFKKSLSTHQVYSVNDGRRSSGVHITPSPSDSGIVDYEVGTYCSFSCILFLEILFCRKSNILRKFGAQKEFFFCGTAKSRKVGKERYILSELDIELEL